MIDNILFSVCEHYKLSKKELKGRDRSYHISRARACFMFISHTEGFSMVSIGKAINRTHGTVWKKINSLSHIDKNEFKDVGSRIGIVKNYNSISKGKLNEYADELVKIIYSDSVKMSGNDFLKLNKVIKEMKDEV